MGELYCDEFRCDASYTNWRPQGTSDWLIIYTQAGAARLVSARGECTTQPGDVVLYEPHELHDYSTQTETGHWNLLWAHFTPKAPWVPWLRWPATEVGLKFLRLGQTEVHGGFQAAMVRMIQTFQRPHPIARDLAMLALEEALLWARLAAFRDEWVTMDDRVRRAIDYLTTHYREPFHLGKLAGHCAISVSRLAHLFKQETGLSPQRFLEKHRMEMASRLLRLTSFTIAEVASETGYDDPFYFSNRFHRYSGKSPTRFREQPG